MADTTRRPKAVRTQDSAVTIEAAPPQEADASLETLEPPAAPKRGFSWFSALSAVLGAILSLAIGLWIDALVRDLFARAPVLGWIGLGLAAALALLVIGLVWREIAAIRRQAHVDGLRDRAAEAVEADDRSRAVGVVRELVRLYGRRPETASGRAKLKEIQNDVIDGAALIGLTEDYLMAALDKDGLRLVTQAAQRVSIVTAVSPRAIIDVGYVLFESVRLVRTLSELYGGRPGLFGFLRLARSVIAHLAVTGGIAVGETFLHQVLGTGLASRISARLGEGVLNGFLTARIGLAALDLCRPLPFSDRTRPTLNRVMSAIMSSSETKETA
ncbi:MAG: TIGR01620 family protein [Pseudomonadota bacterium]